MSFPTRYRQFFGDGCHLPRLDDLPAEECGECLDLLRRLKKDGVPRSLIFPIDSVYGRSAVLLCHAGLVRVEETTLHGQPAFRMSPLRRRRVH